jgi:cobalt-zinc-cadmium efflux system protein
VPELVHGETEAERSVLRGLRLAIELSAVILVLEGVGALFSHSLSLTVDAVHNVPDLLAFAVSWGSLAATERGALGGYTFGRHRLEVFATLLNGALVLGTGIAFGTAALLDLGRGQTFAGSVDAVWILAVAAPTLGLRLANLIVLRRIPGRARDLNLRSVLLHLASDLLITASLLAAGAVLLVSPATTSADALAALVIAAILVYESVPLFREGFEVLTERTPRDISLDKVRESALQVPRVTGVHDVHVWAVCPTLVCMTAHVSVDEMSVRDGMDVVRTLREKMEEEFGILHAVFEVETGAPPG